MALLKSIRTSKADDKSVVKKASKTITVGAKTTVGAGIGSKMQTISALVVKKLGHHKDEYIVIRTVEDLNKYLDDAEAKKKCALDTETTGLNWQTDTLVGFSMYSKGLKPCYIPVRHRSYITQELSPNQLTSTELAECFKDRDIDWIFHNATFDKHIMYKEGVNLKCYWDTQVAANLIDENESHALKDLHLKYCPEEGEEESIKFEHLFKDVDYRDVPIDIAKLYAAGDPKKTFDVYEYQVEKLKKMPRVMSVMTDIEMPITEVCFNMETRGTALDFDIAEQLSVKYHNKREEVQEHVNEVLSTYKEQIVKFIERHPGTVLKYPMNLGSPQQLSVFFYDVLGLTSPIKKKPRSTDEEVLTEFAKGEHATLCKVILELRAVDKLLSTYIDKMPELARIDGRIHAEFNQYGAKTGRFSSKDPKYSWACA